MRKIKKSKKAFAPINFMISLGVGIFILVILFFVMAIAGSHMDTAAITTRTYATLNESGSINQTGYRLSSATSVSGSYGFAITRIANLTGDLIINAANYTVNTTGHVLNATSATYPFVVINYTYSLDSSGAAGQITGNFTSAIGSQGSNISLWLTLGGMIVLVGIVVIIIVMMRKVQMGNQGGNL